MIADLAVLEVAACNDDSALFCAVSWMPMLGSEKSPQILIIIHKTRKLVEHESSKRHLSTVIQHVIRAIGLPGCYSVCKIPLIF